jgi:hypothetical protein
MPDGRLPRQRLTALAALCLIALPLHACRDDAPAGPPAETPATPPEPAAPAPAAAPPDSQSDSILVGDPPTWVPGPLRSPPADWTPRTTTVARGDGVATLTEFRTAAHPGFDRAVFTFDAAIPGYHVEYVDKPTYRCGSGEALFLEGQAWLLIRMQPAQAHDEAGNATITERSRTLDLPVLREAAMTCDFEADVTWVLGLTSPGGYRITELDGPARLVVDVRR